MSKFGCDVSATTPCYPFKKYEELQFSLEQIRTMPSLIFCQSLTSKGCYFFYLKETV